MKFKTIGLCLLLMSALLSCAQQKAATTATTNNTNAEQELLQLSKEKWRWMAEKKADTLAELFHEKSMFVHMGGSWDKQRELDVISRPLKRDVIHNWRGFVDKKVWFSLQESKNLK